MSLTQKQVCLARRGFSLLDQSDNMSGKQQDCIYSHGRLPAWARGPLARPWKCGKVLFVLQMLSKISVDEVFMHYFGKMSASGSFAPGPHWGTFVLQTPSLPTREKILTGTHVYSTIFMPTLATTESGEHQVYGLYVDRSFPLLCMKRYLVT